jgi:hypothetical protein
MLAVILGSTIVFQGHIAVLHSKDAGQYLAAVAPTTHRTRLVIPYDSVRSWNPKRSGLTLTSDVLPTALPYNTTTCGARKDDCVLLNDVTIGGRAAYSIEIPDSHHWDVRLRAAAQAVVGVDLARTDNPGLSMGQLNRDSRGRAADADPREFPPDARVRMVFLGGNATVEPALPTDSARNLRFVCDYCGGLADKCVLTAGTKLTDRLAWRIKEERLTIEFVRRHPGLSGPPVLELERNAEVWLINDSVETGREPYGDAAAKSAHLHHFYEDWMATPNAKGCLLRRQYGAGPVFCPAVALEY